MTCTPDPKVPAMPVMSLLAELDQTQAELQDEFPGWRIWYVYHPRGITWAAQREPVLNTRSAEDLRAAIQKIRAAWLVARLLVVADGRPAVTGETIVIDGGYAATT